jgi:hypothetical protein
VIPLPEIPIARAKWATGYWPKLAIFQRGMFDPDDIVLYFDVDVLITDGLDPFVDLIAREGGLRIIREWNPDVWRLLPVSLRPDRGGNGSLVGFRASEQHSLFDDFCRAPLEMDRRYYWDQRYITERAIGSKYWPDGWCMSFRRQCVKHWPLNLVFPTPAKPSRGKLVVFHGRPNPTEMVEDGTYRWGTKWRYGFGPVPWVQQYWRKYREEPKAPAGVDRVGAAA